MNRGEFKNKDHGRNLLLFKGMNYSSNITPTDIDFAFEYRRKLFILGEFKHNNSPKITDGQRFLVESLVDNMRIPCISFVANHDFDGDVMAKDCTIRGVYYNKHFKSANYGKWCSKGWNELTVGKFISGLGKKYGFETLTS